MNRRESITALMACCGSLPASEIQNVHRAIKQEESAHYNLWDGLVFPVIQEV